MNNSKKWNQWNQFIIEENWMIYILDEFESRKINCINEKVEF